jgi:hypothetical protein
MFSRNLIQFVKIFLVLLMIDWILGIVITSGHLPLWTFLIPNFPFGIAHIWLESHWTGTNFMIEGKVIDELISMIVFPSVIVLQACLYCILINRMKSPSMGAQSA